MPDPWETIDCYIGPGKGWKITVDPAEDPLDASNMLHIEETEQLFLALELLAPDGAGRLTAHLEVLRLATGRAVASGLTSPRQALKRWIDLVSADPVGLLAPRALPRIFPPIFYCATESRFMAAVCQDCSGHPALLRDALSGDYCRICGSSPDRSPGAFLFEAECEGCGSRDSCFGAGCGLDLSGSIPEPLTTVIPVAWTGFLCSRSQLTMPDTAWTKGVVIPRKTGSGQDQSPHEIDFIPHTPFDPVPEEGEQVEIGPFDDIAESGSIVLPGEVLVGFGDVCRIALQVPAEVSPEMLGGGGLRRVKAPAWDAEHEREIRRALELYAAERLGQSGSR